MLQLQAKASGLTHPCVVAYAHAIFDSFSQKALGACIPQYMAGDSFKQYGFIRGSMTIGTGGIGYVAMAPTVVNNLPSIIHTTSAFTGVAVDTTIATTGVEAIDCVNLQVASSDIDASPNVASGRIVAAALSIEYASAIKDIAGTVYSFSSINRTPADGQTVATLGAIRNCARQRVDAKSLYLPQFGINQYEQMYSGDTYASANLKIYPYSGEIDQDGTAEVPATALFLVEGTPGHVFNFEYVIHAEIIGRAVTALTTKSDAHEMGARTVSTAAAETLAQASGQARTSGSATQKNFWNSFIDNVNGNLRGFGDTMDIVNDIASNPRTLNTLQAIGGYAPFSNGAHRAVRALQF